MRNPLNINRYKSKRAEPGLFGFSVIEVMVVVTIVLIVSAIAIPSISQTVANYKLDAAGHATASLLQQARLLSVKTNQIYYANFTTGTPNMAYADLNSSGSVQSGDPEVEISPNISFQTSSLPDHTQLDAYVEGSTNVLTNPGSTIGFTARGLPCQVSTTNPPCQQGAAFEWFLQDTSGRWEAVTVTPAGRIKSWRLNLVDSTSQYCGYPACWR